MYRFQIKKRIHGKNVEICFQHDRHIDDSIVKGINDEIDKYVDNYGFNIYAKCVIAKQVFTDLEDYFKQKELKLVRVCVWYNNDICVKYSPDMRHTG
jgi:hypothetical protein